ncbi:TPA: YnfC family lipoprotein [Yersinia enterocolitica]|uniref:YnfC family lipoprotein n=1 Tax=Yersinia enterocolitica TaxID=630 RepID=UPI0005E9BABD|nr:YnfC family lipoprotein [Yersinia enterocolitica]EKN4095722.1 YnfC family lipoprotein [Yersinia enterocolitica]EKN4832506.1 YnfC family lipoprotein [Yersinia enterocolitica]EKN4854260.1 YnfC family lipoprotein [Yersinia enterocolitica]EKN4914273.1 YnfC family lipoprotein [Yersinia enterocolitica]EKN5099328.1 YnfC family lipoprotein [Yersinia enterocolitica]
MKRIISVCTLIVVLSACDRNNESLVFTPNVASISNIFGLDPLHGPVKSLSQKMLDANGNVISEAHANIDEKGCFTSIKVRTPISEIDTDYVKDGNFYINSNTKEKKLILNEKCNITQTMNGDVKALLNDKGFVTDVKISESGKIRKHYEYDESGYPILDVSYEENFVNKIVTEFDAKAINPFNYETKTYINDKLEVSTTRDCTIDSHGNPVFCKIKDIYPDGRVTEAYSVMYNTEYY